MAAPLNGTIASKHFVTLLLYPTGPEFACVVCLLTCSTKCISRPQRRRALPRHRQALLGNLMMTKKWTGIEPRAITPLVVQKTRGRLTWFHCYLIDPGRPVLQREITPLAMWNTLVVLIDLS